MAAIFRRHGAFRDTGLGDTVTRRNGSVASTTSIDAPRRSSLAVLSRRFTRSKIPTSSNDVCSPVNESSNRLGQLFLSLPDEVLTDIVSYLEKEDLYALRLTCQTTFWITHNNSSTILRSLLPQIVLEDDVPYIQALYPPLTPNRTTDFVLQILHRHRVVEKTVEIAVSYIQMKLYVLQPALRFEHFQTHKHRLLQKLQRAGWTISSFLDRFRSYLIYDHLRHTHSPGPATSQSSTSCWACQEWVRDWVNNLPKNEIVPTYHIYGLILLHFQSSLRVPGYSGGIEKFKRRHRGVSMERQLPQFMIFGGMEYLSRVSILKGTYNQRLDIVRNFVENMYSTLRGPEKRSRSIPFAMLRNSSSTNVDTIAVENLRGSTSSSSSGNVSMISSEDQPLPVAGLSRSHYGRMPSEPPFEDISPRAIEAVPPLDQILGPMLIERILREEIAKDINDLGTPFEYIQMLVKGFIDEEEAEVEVEASNNVEEAATERELEVTNAENAVVEQATSTGETAPVRNTTQQPPTRPIGNLSRRPRSRWSDGWGG